MIDKRKFWKLGQDATEPPECLGTDFDRLMSSSGEVRAKSHQWVAATGCAPGCQTTVLPGSHRCLLQARVTPGVKSGICANNSDSTCLDTRPTLNSAKRCALRGARSFLSSVETAVSHTEAENPLYLCFCLEITIRSQGSGTQTLLKKRN